MTLLIFRLLSPNGSEPSGEDCNPPYPMDRLDQHLDGGAQLTQLKELRFSPDLERRYKAYITESNRTPAYVYSCSVLIVWSVFAVLDFVRLANIPDPKIDVLTVIWLAARWIALGFLITAVFVVRSPHRKYDHFVLATYLAVGLAIPITADIARLKGAFSIDASQIVVIMCGFLPIGLVFRRAFFVTSIVTASCLVFLALGVYDRSMGHQVQLGIIILLALPAAALGGYFREYADRAQFVLGLRLDENASLDTLTNLPNRRKFHDHLTIALAQALRDKKPLCLAMADIDHFKQLNDTYGHPAGDEIICAVGQAFKTAARRPLDIVARYGGEEFIFLFYACTEAGAAERVDFALQSVRDLNRCHQGSPTGTVTASIGYTVMAEGQEADADTLIGRADQALYAAKQAGRNTMSFRRF